MEIDATQAHRAVVDHKHMNTEAALDFIFTQGAQPLGPQPNPSTASSSSPANAANRMAPLLAAAQQVTTAPNNTPIAKPVATGQPPPALTSSNNNKSNEDMEVERAIQLSLQDTTPPSTLLTSTASLPGSVSADEQAAQAAIMASILSSAASQREDGVWVDPANPHQRTRRGGVPTGLKNTGNICYFNSLMQVYFHLRPTLFRAIMAVQPPQPPQSQQSQSQSQMSVLSVGGGVHVSGVGTSKFVVNGQQVTLPNATHAQNVIINENGVFVDGKQVNIDKQSANSQPQPTTGPSPAVAFLLSLQRLFAHLHLSNRRYLDPIATVSALFAASGHSAKEQRMQHDASEFHDLIVETMHQALSPTPATSPAASSSTTTTASSNSSSAASAASSVASSPSSSTATNSSVIRDMFFARAIQEMRFTDDKGTLQTQQSTSSHGPLILHIAGGSLMSALDEYTHTTITDYRTNPTSPPTPATSSLWFERLPTVLCFQLQRVGYDAVRREAVKDNRFFRLDETMWMDRYVVGRRVESESVRVEVGGWKEQRAKVESEMKRLMEYNGSSIALNAALDVSAHYVASLPAAPLAPASHAAIATYLSTLSSSITATLAQLSAERERLTTLIDHAYDNMRSEQSEYRLLAVLVHDGKEAGTGHYWSYIRRTRQEEEESKAGGGDGETGAGVGRFWKYNDAVVSAVDDATMWRESEGGQPNTNASAYFLVYIKHSEATAPDTNIDHLITHTLREEVRKDNDKLRAETDEWDRKEEDKVVEAEAERVKKRYVEGEAQLKDLDKKVGEKKEVEAEEGVDWRLFSFPAFLKLHPLAALPQIQQLPLYQLVMEALSEVRCAPELVQRVKERSIALLLKDGHHVASRVSQQLSESDVRIVEERRREWDEYMAVSTSEARGLMRLTDGSKHIKSALCCLLRAQSRWETMAAAQTADKYGSKQRELSVYLQLVLYLLYMSAKIRLRSSATPACYSDLQLVSAVSTAFPVIRPFYQQEIVMLASERDGDEHMEPVVHDFIGADMDDSSSDEEKQHSTANAATKRNDRLVALVGRLEADEGAQTGEAVDGEEDKVVKREGLFALHSRLCSLVGVKLKHSLARVKALMAGRGEGEEEKEEEVGEVAQWMVVGGVAEAKEQAPSNSAVRQEEKEAGAADAEMTTGKADAISESQGVVSGGGDVAVTTAAPMDDSS